RAVRDDRGVLLGEATEGDTIGIAFERGRAMVDADGLAPGIKNDALRDGAADDGGMDGDRLLEPFANAGDAGVRVVHEDIGPRLYLIEAINRAGDHERAGAAAGDDFHRQARCLDGASRADDRLHGGMDAVGPFREVGDVDEMPLVRLDAPEADAGKVR